MAYKIDPNKCIGCHTCMGMCPVCAISVGADNKCVIDPAKCISCGTCASVCPVCAIAPAPVETKPAEQKPMDTKPVEPKPAEQKPMDTKPVEPKPESK